jgi:hypothetical protein
MRDYFYSVFPGQLRQLSYSTLNATVDEAFGLRGTPFFGGTDWKNVGRDLSRVTQEDRVPFVLALFMMVLTDQAIYTYSRDSYEDWKRHTAFPKFGWVGFGPHHENPLKILWVPEKEQLVDPAEVVAAIPNFVEFLVDETKRTISAYGLPMKAQDHFEAILQDKAFAFNVGTIIPAFKSEFAKALERQ